MSTLTPAPTTTPAPGGSAPAVPTYFFIGNMVLLLGLGLGRLVLGDLPLADHTRDGLLHFGQAGTGLLLGASLFKVLHAFASGGAAVTGVEAISNGVPAFRRPAWRNARTTLVVMGSLLGAMFLGLSVLAAHMQVAPFEDGTPTVISQVGDLVYGGGVLGRVLYLSLQAGTMLILVLAANTSYADFPRLASFQAGDSFMPRQLTKRGHRLVFSNGILFLSAFAVLLVVVTGAQVDRLIPLYAIGVFTSFTLSQAGMARHHLREREPGWHWGLFINGFGAVLTLVVAIVIAVTKFTASSTTRPPRPSSARSPGSTTPTSPPSPSTSAPAGPPGKSSTTAPPLCSPRPPGPATPARPVATATAW